MTAVPEELKNELVLCFSFRLIGKIWKRATDRPQIIRIANEDCRSIYQLPALIGAVDGAAVEVRVYDERAINVLNDPVPVIDWSNTLCRCKNALISKCREITGHESDVVDC